MTECSDLFDESCDGYLPENDINVSSYYFYLRDVHEQRCVGY